MLMILLLLLLLDLLISWYHMSRLGLWPGCRHTERHLLLLSLLHQGLVCSTIYIRVVSCLCVVRVWLGSVLVHNLWRLERCSCALTKEFLLLARRMALWVALRVLLVDLLEEVMVNLRHESLWWLIVWLRLLMLRGLKWSLHRLHVMLLSLLYYLLLLLLVCRMLLMLVMGVRLARTAV